MAEAVSAATFAPALKVDNYTGPAKQVAAANDEMAKSANRVSEASEKATAKTTVTATAIDKLAERVDRAARAQAVFERQSLLLHRALADGNISAERHAQLMAKVEANYRQATAAADRFNRQAAGGVVQLTGVRGAVDQLSGGLSVANRALGVFGVGLGAGAVIAFGKHVVDTIGGLAEQAEQLGITAKTLQVYEHHALQAGVQSEQLQTGIAKLTRTIGEAVDGSDDAIKAFNKLGVGILDASGKVRSTDAVIADLAVKISALEDPSARAAAAVDFFGKAGQKLLPLLSEIARNGMPALIEAAERAGAVVGDDLVERFDKASDAFARWGMQATVVAAKVLGAVGEVAEKLPALLDRAITPWADYFARLGKLYLDWVGTPFAKLLRGENPFATQPQTIIPGGENWPKVPFGDAGGGGSATSGNRTSNPRSTKEIEEEAKAIEKLRGELNKLRGDLDPVVKARLEYAKSLDTINAAAERNLITAKEEVDLRAQAEDHLDAEIRKVSDYSAGLIKAWEAQEKRNRGLETWIEGLDDEARAMKLGNTERKISEALRQGEAKLLDELGRKTRDLTDAERERIRTSVESREVWEEQAKAAEKLAQETERAKERAADRVTDFAADSLFDRLMGKVENLWETFERLGKRAIADIAAELLVRPFVLEVAGSCQGSPAVFGIAQTVEEGIAS